MRRAIAVACATLALAPATPGTAQEPRPLSLEAAVGAATAEAPTLAIAGARVEQAVSIERQARSALRPRLDVGSFWMNRTYNQAALGLPASGAPGVSDRVGPFNLWDSRITSRHALFDPAGQAAVGAARLGVDAAQTAREAAGEAVAARVALAFADAVHARELLAARLADLALARELTRITAAQLRSGDATPLDVTRAEMQRVRAQGDSLVAAHGVARTGIELARVLGWPATTAIAPTGSLADLAREWGETPETGAGHAATRPEVRAERAALRVHDAELRAVRAERLPRIDLFGDLGWSGTHGGNLLATGQVGVAVTVPLLDGWSRHARVAEQRALAAQAGLREREAHLRADAEIRMALLDLAAAQDRRRIAGELARLAERELEQARLRFVEGVADNTAIIQAQQALVAARDAGIAAEYQAATGRIRNAQANGAARALR